MAELDRRTAIDCENEFELFMATFVGQRLACPGVLPDVRGMLRRTRADTDVDMRRKVRSALIEHGVEVAFDKIAGTNPQFDRMRMRAIFEKLLDAFLDNEVSEMWKERKNDRT